jgi:hypothetical protein
MARLRKDVYRPPAVRTWSVEDKNSGARAVVSRYDNGSLKIWTPDLGLQHEGVEIPLDYLDEFCQAVAEAHTWTDDPPGTTAV